MGIRMLKFALALGISAEWLTGPAAHTLPAIGQACFRALLFTLLAWMILEGCRVLVHAVMTLDA
jgi:hypothetical protein